MLTAFCCSLPPGYLFVETGGVVWFLMAIAAPWGFVWLMAAADALIDGAD